MNNNNKLFDEAFVISRIINVEVSAICWWLAGGRLSKVGGRGGCLVLTPPLS